jgi:ubiquitin C-terminal hydrolase
MCVRVHVSVVLCTFRLLFIALEGDNSDNSIQLTAGDKTVGGAKYSLLAVIYYTGTHFFSQVKMEGSWYFANDCEQCHGSDGGDGHI